METSKLIESESTTASAPLKRQGDDDSTSTETKKPKMKSKRELTISDLQHVIDRHNAAREYDPEDYMIRCGSDYWEFYPEEHYLYKKMGVTYTVTRKMKGKCGWGWRCDYYCSDCKKCSHQFECDCEDGKEGNMCGHIHRACRYLKKQEEDESEDEEVDESEDENEEDEEEDDSTETPKESEDDDEDKTDQRKASSITSKAEKLLQEVRALVTGKRNADIIIKNLKSTIALVKNNKKEEDDSQN